MPPCRNFERDKTSMLAQIPLCRIEIKREYVKWQVSERGDSYLLVVSMGYDHSGKRRADQQKTVKPPESLSPKQREFL